MSGGREKGYTVGSHLSELQLSEHVCYPNAFSKATPTISRYLTSTGKVGFTTKVRATVKLSHWVPLAYRMKWKLSNGLRLCAF